ncbi:MAG TPA: dipeptide epimerase [Candidatus Acidoferrales bacterium]|nr:dipeptide epimerase [Candidatus Acidoferrales bacterium]
MIVSRISVELLEVPLREPFVMSFFAVTHGRHAIVTVEAGEVSGTGAVCAIPPLTGETAESVGDAVRSLAPVVAGVPLADRAELHARMNAALYGNASAKAAIDFAVHDALGKTLGVPVSTLLGGRRRETVPCTWIIGDKPLETTTADVRKRYADGFRTFKLKIGRDDELDIARIRSVRAQMGDSIKLRVDANAGYTRERAARILSAMDEANLELIEQPLARNDLGGHRWLRTRLRAPIMLDESVGSASDVVAIADAEAADLIYIKAAKAGGLYPATAIANVAEAAHLGVVVGGNVELAPGCAANLHFAASFGLNFASDACVGMQMHSPEVMEQFERVGDAVRVPTSPGLGARSGLTYSST